MDLAQKKCVPCEGGVPPLDPGNVQRYLAELKTGWAAFGNQKIKKEFKFKDFREAVAFVNKIADIAESEGHHPDISIFYNKVVIELMTHAAQGLTENDFVLAAKIDKI